MAEPEFPSASFDAPKVEPLFPPLRGTAIATLVLFTVAVGRGGSYWVGFITGVAVVLVVLFASVLGGPLFQWLSRRWDQPLTFSQAYRLHAAGMMLSVWPSTAISSFVNAFTWWKVLLALQVVENLVVPALVWSFAEVNGEPIGWARVAKVLPGMIPVGLLWGVAWVLAFRH